MTSSLRSRLRAGDRLVGALIRMPNEDLVEMLAVAGHDFVLIDCEHGPADVLALRQHLALAQVHGMSVLVRPGEHEPALIQRALDQGADGIVAPHIDDAAGAAELVRATRYPPEGARGFATYPRAGRFGTVPASAHHAAAAENTLVLAMLESPAAVSAASSILSVPGIDGYLVGAADLGAALQHSSTPGPTLVESIAAVHTAGRATGSIRADIVADRAAAHTARIDGAHLVIYNLAAVLMTTLAELREPLG